MMRDLVVRLFAIKLVEVGLVLAIVEVEDNMYPEMVLIKQDTTVLL